MHAYLNEINALSIDGEVLGEPVPFVDNFQELQELCYSYLNTDEIKEGNLRNEFQELTAQWELPQNSKKVEQINEHIR